MKIYNKYVIGILFAATALFTACEENEDFIAENTTPTGVGYYPISTHPITDIATKLTLATAVGSATAFDKDQNLSWELEYFSQSPIKEVNFYHTIGSGSRALISKTPYKPTFSKAKGVDTLIYNYKVPNVASGTVIKLEHEIINENTLTALRTNYIKIK